MSEAEFERRQTGGGDDGAADHANGNGNGNGHGHAIATEPEPAAPRLAPVSARDGRGRGSRAKPAKPRRVQRMFALEEDLDKKLWLYAIHMGKDRSDVVNDLLRPVVASMVLYDSRDRRSGRQADPGPEVEQGGD